MHGMKERSQYCFSGRDLTYIFICFAIMTGVFIWRLHAFSDLEPRADQAFLAWWIKGLVATDHIIPLQSAGESLLDAMARDETGFLTQTLRPIYNSPTELFKILPVFVVFVITKLIGDSYSIQVAISLIASAAIPFALASFPIWLNSTSNRAVSFSIGILALTIAAFSTYLHFFSGWGFHNYGILSLVVAVAVSARIMPSTLDEATGQMSWRAIVGLFLVNGLALYSFKTNLFLLPPATVMALVSIPNLNWRMKFRHVFTYVVIFTILILPFIPLVFISANKPDYAQDLTSPILLMQANLSGNLLDWSMILYTRTLNWIHTAQEFYSLPGLAAGLIGLTALARDGMRLPLCLAIAHYLAWCFVPIFAGASFRTYPYLIPFLALGAAYFLVVSIRSALRFTLNKTIVAAIAGALLITHIATQIPDLRSKVHMAESLPDFWATYFIGQGEIRPMIAMIEQTLPADATLMTWGYGLKFLYRDLKVTELDVELPALNALMLRQKVGLLQGHIKKRRLSVSKTGSLYVLVDHKVDHIDRKTLTTEIASLLGPSGFAVANRIHLVNIASWELQSFWPKNLALYKVVRNK